MKTLPPVIMCVLPKWLSASFYDYFHFENKSCSFGCTAKLNNDIWHVLWLTKQYLVVLPVWTKIHKHLWKSSNERACSLLPLMCDSHPSLTFTDQTMASPFFTIQHVHMGYWHILAGPRGPTPTPHPLHTSSSWTMPVSDSIPPGHVQWRGGQRWTKAGCSPPTHRMQLLQNGHSRHVTQYLKMTSFSLSQLKSKLTLFPSKVLAAMLTVHSIMPVRQSANSFYPRNYR